MITLFARIIEGVFMTLSNITAFAFATPNRGDNNQLIGAFHAISDMVNPKWDYANSFLFANDETDIYQVKEVFSYSNFKNYEMFQTKVFEKIDAYFKKLTFIPKIFIMVYGQTEAQSASANVDMMCKAVKEYYTIHKLGFVLTSVLNSKYHRYKYVDVINIPKHLLTFGSRIRLIKDNEISSKVLVTVGTIHNFSKNNIVKQYNKFMQTIAQDFNNKKIDNQIIKLKEFTKTSKKVVFCLGGRVEGSEIVFDINYADKLFNDALLLDKQGFGVVFVNGPRTPNNVTDYIYEKALLHPRIIFQNSKNIAQNKDDEKHWRIYSGKHKQDFILLSKIGNIYPAVLGFENTLVVHSFDTYACCETLNASVPTAISSKGLYINPKIRYDCFNLQELLCPKYAVDFDDFLNNVISYKIEPKDLKLQTLSNPSKVFAETLINKFKDFS